MSGITHGVELHALPSRELDAADARHLGGRLAMTRLETERSNRNCTKKAGAAADKAAQMTDTCEKIQV